LRKPSASNLIPFFLLLPSLAVMILLYLYPFLSSIYRSFVSDQGIVTLQFYETAITNYKADILFSLEVSLLSTAISTVLSILMAAYLRLTSHRIGRLFNSLYRVPLFVPFVVIAQMMRTFLAPHGLLNVFLAQFGLINLETPLELFDWKGLTIGFVWKQTAFMTLMTLGGFTMIKDDMIEAARSVGANALRVVWSIMVPIARTIIVVAVILIFASNISTFSLPYMFIGGSIPTTMTVDIAHRVMYFRDWGTANALGVISYIVVFAAAIYYMKYMVGRES